LRRLTTTLVLLIAIAGAPSAFAQEASIPDFFRGGTSVDAEAAGGAEPSVVVTVLAQDEPWVGSDDPCTYEVMGFADAQATAFAYLGIQPDTQLGDATAERVPELYASPWLLVTCPSPLFGDLLVGIVQLTTSPPPPELPALMESIVRRSMVLRLPQTRFSPDAAGYQITGVETWVWLDPAYAAPITVTGCAGNGFACASMTARFSHLELDMGDLTTPFACAGLVAYDTTRPSSQQVSTSHCGHVYTQASTGYAVTATAAWDLDWSCRWDADLDGTREASCGGGPLPTAGRTATPLTLEVRDIQARATTD
jgi:hypothetical protein